MKTTVRELNETSGKDNAIEESGGVIQIRVPPDGLVKVPNLDVLGDAMVTKFIAADGSEIVGEPYDSQPGVVRWYGLGLSMSQGKGNRLGWFIGTPEEFAKLDRTAVGF